MPLAGSGSQLAWTTHVPESRKTTSSLAGGLSIDQSPSDRDEDFRDESATSREPTWLGLHPKRPPPLNEDGAAIRSGPDVVAREALVGPPIPQTSALIVH